MNATKNRINLSNMQKEAVQQCKQWFMSQRSSSFVLTGYAGSGKSTCVEALIEELGIDLRSVAFVSPTGKAAMVLTEKAGGRYQATTVHKLCYHYDDVNRFELKHPDKLKEYNLIVCDEASMLSQELLNDLTSFNIPVIFIGDPAQLEPVGTKTTLLDKPDYMLTEIHRQAADNPIIHLSMLARQNKRIRPGAYGNSAYVISKDQIKSRQRVIDLALRADQMIVGKNDTRKAINRSVREALKRTSPLPQIGDKVICSRNNWNRSVEGYPIVNGMTGKVVHTNENVKKGQSMHRDCMEIGFQPDFSEQSLKQLYLLHSDFEGEKEQLNRSEYGTYDQFDYAYAISCHKSQGSQFDSVLVWSEVLNYKSHSRWLYTAITRAAKNLILVV